MSDWDFTGDQYYVDTESRYPLFSDIQTTDYSIAPSAKKTGTGARIVKSPESKFRSEQMGIPAYIGCPCEQCVYNRWLHSQQTRHAPKPTSPPAEQIITFAPLGYMNVDSNMILLVFMFMVIVFVCCFYTKSISELKSQIKLLERQLR
jgi:hypothetical protein